jgi:hypothetical protein
MRKSDEAVVAGHPAGHPRKFDLGRSKNDFAFRRIRR